MGIKKMNRVPYAYSNIARRTFLYNELKEEQLLVIIPQVTFQSLLAADDSDVGKITKALILYLVSDGEETSSFATLGNALSSAWETMIAAMTQYMASFRTRKRRSAATFKREMVNEHIAQDVSDVVDDSPLTIKEHAKHVDMSARLKAILKRPEDMPVFEDL